MIHALEVNFRLFSWYIFEQLSYPVFKHAGIAQVTWNAGFHAHSFGWNHEMKQSGKT